MTRVLSAHPPLRASPHLSAEGVALTPLAWQLDVLPRSLRGSRMPGLRVAMRDRRWMDNVASDSEVAPSNTSAGPLSRFC